MMLTKSLLAVLATSALAVKLFQHLSQKQQLRRAEGEKQQHREEVNRWEAEGGNLPTPQTQTPTQSHLAKYKAPAKRRASRGPRLST
jgi:hypothetical protein